ncbi:hypothetical protein UPYG_G00021010 [Umbra pygmaea]|uniref:Uncharacterized protein n=1 Tax=Umbra pygmaea TaxID=75934 RepID=A0ABD0XKS8_UMBPY
MQLGRAPLSEAEKKDACNTASASIVERVGISLVHAPNATQQPATHPLRQGYRATSVEECNPSGPIHVPSQYHKFAQVFSKEKATHLPPHRPWDCSIDILPDASFPKGRIYPLSLPEKDALNSYI